MILPCEVAAKSVVPTVKALIAKELMDRRGLKQNQVAEILGVSQSAVSKYNRNVRGKAIKVGDVEEIQPFIGSMVTLLMNQTYQRGELLHLFCETCAAIRKRRLMCKFCQRSDPNFEVQECEFCTGKEHGVR